MLTNSLSLKSYRLARTHGSCVSGRSVQGYSQHAEPFVTDVAIGG
jgi:hypothetical protein